jgi:hypothetical protein
MDEDGTRKEDDSYILNRVDGKGRGLSEEAPQACIFAQS